jgi:hypothetical protein
MRGCAAGTLDSVGLWPWSELLWPSKPLSSQLIVSRACAPLHLTLSSMIARFLASAPAGSRSGRRLSPSTSSRQPPCPLLHPSSLFSEGLVRRWSRDQSSAADRKSPLFFRFGLGAAPAEYEKKTTYVRVPLGMSSPKQRNLIDLLQMRLPIIYERV